jgi:hypothetical protein
MKRKQAKNTRYERWITLLASHLRGQGVQCHLAYDDRHLGDRLVLSLPLAEGFCELQVVRGDKGANLCVLAGSQGAADRLAALLTGVHRTAKRRHNAKRRFLHRLEWVAQHLQQTFEPRQQRFPQAALERLRTVLPEAAPLIGVRTPFQQKADPEDERLELEAAQGRLARQLRRYKLLFAARIHTSLGGRAALYYKNVDGFCPRGEALNVVAIRLKESGVAPAALLAPPAPDGHERDWGEILDAVGDGVELAVDATELAVDLADVVGASDSCWDVGGIDLPDCGGLDIPDCGGCDCPL